MDKTGKKKGSLLVTVILVLIFLTGLGLIAYPTLSDWWNKVTQAKVVEE